MFTSNIEKELIVRLETEKKYISDEHRGHFCGKEMNFTLETVNLTNSCIIPLFSLTRVFLKASRCKCPTEELVKA